MYINLKKFLKNRKVLLENFLSLSILQVANYILPLLTVPYLIRVLGFEYFGLIAFAVATVEYFMILTNYGFELTATREISMNQSNKEKISEIFSSVILIKLFLMVFSFFILTILIFSFEKFHKDWIIYYLTFGVVLGNVLFPSWFFQGIENMKYITILNFISKTIFVLAIFIFVKFPSDYYLVPFFNFLGALFSGIIAQIIVRKNFGIKFKFQNLNTLRKYLIDGWYIFISRVAVSLYTTTNVFLLGIFTNNTQVGYFSAIEKVVVAIGRMLDPINQAIYPHLAKLYKKDFKVFIKEVKRFRILLLAVSLTIFILSFLFKDWIIYIITGSYNKELSFLLGIFLLRVITYPIAPFLSNILIIIKKNKEYVSVMILTVVLNFLLVPVSIYYFGVKGLVISFIVVIYIHVLMLYIFNKKFLNQGIK